MLRAAKNGGDFCATRDAAELEARYGPLANAGYTVSVDKFPPRAVCTFHTTTGGTIRVSEY